MPVAVPGRAGRLVRVLRLAPRAIPRALGARALLAQQHERVEPRVVAVAPRRLDGVVADQGDVDERGLGGRQRRVGSRASPACPPRRGSRRRGTASAASPCRSSVAWPSAHSRRSVPAARSASMRRGVVRLGSCMPRSYSAAPAPTSGGSTRPERHPTRMSAAMARSSQGRPCRGPVCSGRMSLVVDHLSQAVRVRRRPRRSRVRGRPRPGVRLPGRQRRRQDHDDADHGRRARARRRPGHVARHREPPAAAVDVGLPARGARPVPAHARARSARVLRRASTACPPERAKREAMAWLRRFRAEDLAGRRAEQLSKGNQQKVQFVAAVLHEPAVLLMDEPFTGLDPVNVMLLREAFLELRDRGRTVVFSTHQMEVAEALCESVAIVDRGRMVVGGTLREVRRSTGRRIVVDLGPGRPPAAVARRRGRRAGDPGGHGPHERRARPGHGAGRRCWPRPWPRARGSPTSRSPTRRSSRCSSTTWDIPADEVVHLAPADGEDAA